MSEQIKKNKNLCEIKGMMLVPIRVGILANHTISGDGWNEPKEDIFKLLDVKFDIEEIEKAIAQRFAALGIDGCFQGTWNCEYLSEGDLK